MKTILVASDLSVRSDRAVARAFRLAERLGARLVVQHVIDEDYPEDMRAAMVGKARDALARTCAAQPGTGKVTVEQVVTEAHAVPAIHAEAEACGADLIVLGLHRARGIFDVFRETTMERLVRASALPMLLVSDPADTDYESVVAAVDTSPASTRALACAGEIAPGASFSCFYAYHIPFKGLTAVESQPGLLKSYLVEAERELDVWLSTAKLPAGLPRPRVIDGGPHQALAMMLETMKPDLLAVGSHARANPQRWILGSFTAELVRNPPCDLLVSP